jgi:hypothetical protein
VGFRAGCYCSRFAAAPLGEFEMHPAASALIFDKPYNALAVFVYCCNKVEAAR